jgi:DNA-binding NarL/FixJ family response regulator
MTNERFITSQLLTRRTIMQPLKVIVADDHAGFRELLTGFLRSQGVEVVGVAKNGTEAVEQADQCSPDLVLMDISMPKLGGFEATRMIKRLHPKTKVVIISSHTGEVYRKAAMENSADGFIEKDSIKGALLSLIGNEGRSIRVAV